jgi:hypothetical protein
MRIEETSLLLAKIQAFDNRNVDEAALSAWSEVVAAHTLTDCLAAVTDYYRSYSAWIMPAHIVERVRAMEEDRVNQFKDGYHLNPADEDRILLSGDSASWSNGMRALHRAVRTGALSPDVYAAYQDGTQPLEAFLTRKAIK